MESVELFIRITIGVVSSGLMLVWVLDKIHVDYTLLTVFKRRGVAHVNMPSRTIIMFTVGLLIAYLPVAMISGVVLTPSFWVWYYCGATMWIVGADIAADRRTGELVHYKILAVSYIVGFCSAILAVAIGLIVQ